MMHSGLIEYYECAVIGNNPKHETQKVKCRVASLHFNDEDVIFSVWIFRWKVDHTRTWAGIFWKSQIDEFNHPTSNWKRP